MMDAVQTNTKKTFLSGVLLLSISTLLVKLIGLIYKIPMLTYLGSEGMGYFNSAYEIYALFCVIATAGLPVALSVLISQAIAKGESFRVQRIYRVAMTVFLWLGVLGTAVMMLFAGTFCKLIKSQNAFYCILSIAPTIFFVCISSALRGYFQGHQRMLPTAISQIIESVGKLVFGLVLARYALHQGYSTATVAAFAGLGLTLGTAVSMLYLMLEKKRFSRTCDSPIPTKSETFPEKYRDVLKKLAKLAIPMTLGASLVSVTKLIDMTMILRRLQSIGYTEIGANEAYGSYTTLALSVYGLLPALVNAVALPLVPMLSAAIASKDQNRQEQMIRTSYRLTALFAIPAALGVAAFARPILTLLFGSDPEAVAAASPLLSYLGVSVFLSCMITATNSVLHAYEEVNRPILSMLAGAGVKIVGAYFLIGIPQIALLGAPISTFLCNAAVVLINLYFATKLCAVRGLRPIFLKPLLCAALAVGGSLWLFWTLCRYSLGQTAAFLIAMAVAVLGYLLLSCLFGVFCAEDVALLPFGEKLCSVLRRLHLLRRINREEQNF
ncbi:MAG: polysaccharide biosynthesis protein [Clostridia bacterium]|nr:polysaccharide biosynthesis protein [Clostridia bacterium]